MMTKTDFQRLIKENLPNVKGISTQDATIRLYHDHVSIVIIWHTDTNGSIIQTLRGKASDEKVKLALNKYCRWTEEILSPVGGLRFEKVDYEVEQPTVSGRYFTYNERLSISGVSGGQFMQMQSTVFDLIKGRVWDNNPVVSHPIKYWLKPILNE